jgi:Holliday junction resolvase RusA-like endonuclease
MSWEFECLIPGPPIGKGRPRATKMGGHIRLYTPKKTADWERSAALLARNAWMRAPSEDYCRLEVVAVFSRPKRLLRKKDPEERMWHGSKPDIDNVVKSVADSLVMAGVIRDDTQVVEIHARKVYATKSEGPGVEVRLCSIDIEPPSG